MLYNIFVYSLTVVVIDAHDISVLKETVIQQELRPIGRGEPTKFDAERFDAELGNLPIKDLENFGWLFSKALHRI